MRTLISRWFLFGLLFGWALTHATVFGQQTGKTTDTKPVTVDKIRQGLDKTITIDYTGQTLAEALNHFREKTGLPINIDSVAFMNQMPMPPGGDPMGGQVTIKGTNEKASQILRRTLSAHRLSYVFIDDAILVTSEDTAVMRQMRQRVSVDLDEVPLKKAARDLAKNHGINLVIDPKVMKQAEAPVSLQLDNTGIETTMRLLAELASLKAVRMGNVVFITNEEKAKRIQDEEKHQFDNPLNPNMPGIAYPPAIGLVGGFGGIAMPAQAIQKVAPPVVDVAPPPPVQAPPPPVKPIDPVNRGGSAPANPPPPPPLPSVQRPVEPPPTLPPGRQ
jgi:hypothetical protein